MENFRESRLVAGRWRKGARGPSLTLPAARPGKPSRVAGPWAQQAPCPGLRIPASELGKR